MVWAKSERGGGGATRARATRAIRARRAARTGMGRNGSWYFAWPVAAIVASVRPWKDFLAERMTGSVTPRVVRACLRASLIAASFASAPELQKKTCAAAGRRAGGRARGSAQGLAGWRGGVRRASQGATAARAPCRSASAR